MTTLEVLEAIAEGRARLPAGPVGVAMASGLAERVEAATLEEVDLRKKGRNVRVRLTERGERVRAGGGA